MNRAPDFENILSVLRREKPSRPTPFEMFMGDHILSHFSGEKSPGRDAGEQYQEYVIKGFLGAGFDYAAVRASDFMFQAAEQGNAQTISLNNGLICDKPSVFWNDIGWPVQGVNNLPHLLSHYYNTVPEGVVDDRFNGLYHDFLTKEYKQGQVNRNEKWEMCRGLGLSFGYNSEESDDSILKPEEAISLLVSVVSENGNLLLNIGPKADGTIPEEQVRRLKVIGEWLEVNGDGIYGTKCSRQRSIHKKDGSSIYFTCKNHDLYFFADKMSKKYTDIIIPEVTGNAVPLDPRITCTCTQMEDGLHLHVINHTGNNYAMGFLVKGAADH